MMTILEQWFYETLTSAANEFKSSSKTNKETLDNIAKNLSEINASLKTIAEILAR